MSKNKEKLELTSEEFQKLQAHWYRKLAKSGFKDAERPALRDDTRDTLRSHFHKTPERCEDDTEYYRCARQFIFDCTFDCLRDKKIWSLHADGCSYREIAALLGGMTYFVAFDCVTKYKKRMLLGINIAPKKNRKRKKKKRKAAKGICYH